MAENDDDGFSVNDEAYRQRGRDQAVRLKQQAEEGGLRFSVYLPPTLSTWLLGLVADGTFADPGEAIFVLMGETKDLWTHAPDLRHQILVRSLQAAKDDPRPTISGEEMCEHMRLMLTEPRREPAVWVD